MAIRWAHPSTASAMCPNQSGSQFLKGQVKGGKHSLSLTFLNSKIFKIFRWCPRFCGVPVHPTNRYTFRDPIFVWKYVYFGVGSQSFANCNCSRRYFSLTTLILFFVLILLNLLTLIGSLNANVSFKAARTCLIKLC